MTTIWEDKIVAINPLIENGRLLGTAIVSKNQKYFYAANVDIEKLIEPAKHIITFDDNPLNFRALYYQFKPSIKFQTLGDIVKQEYFTTETHDVIYFDRPEKARQTVIEAVFMLQFFLKHYKNRNKEVYNLDRRLIELCKNYQAEIEINETAIRTELSLVQKQQWDTERKLFHLVGYPITSLVQIKDESIKKKAEKYLGQINIFKQKYENLIQFLDVTKLKLEFDITSTATGRILCRDRENDIGLFTPEKSLRELFIANKECVFISADYKRQEACILAKVAEDEQLELDVQNEDFYSRLARWAIGDTNKQSGKILFYAVIYGAKPETVANELGIDSFLANQAINKIKKRYSDLNYWLKNFKAKTNYFGRPLHTNTVNAYIQSTASDILKDRLLATFSFNPVLILSDNIIYQVKHYEIEKHIEIIKNLLQKTYPFKLEVDLKTSYNLKFN